MSILDINDKNYYIKKKFIESLLFQILFFFNCIEIYLNIIKKISSVL